MIRLEPMSESEFSAYLERAIPRFAESQVLRGVWVEQRSMDASRAFYADRLPQGRETPGHHFCTIVDAEAGTKVGEVWYSAEEVGGNLRFWIEWIWIESSYRRRGYATQALHHLEQEARGLGAVWIGLSVWMDNAEAVSLYSKLGYSIALASMRKLLNTHS
jgi:ribosomal protein S18 acetylase RimI-like enzyme